MAKLFFMPVLALLLITTGYADVGPYGYTRLDSFAAVVWLIYLMSTAGLFFLLRTAGKGTIAFAVILFFLGVLWAGLGFLAINYLYGFMFFVVGLLGLTLGTAAASASKARGGNVRRRGVFVLFLLILIIISQFGLFGFRERNYGRTITTGWAKLHPLSQTIVYDSPAQNFSASFVNTVGTAIRLESVTVNETITNTMCDASFLGLKGYPVYGNLTVDAGDTLMIKARCPQAQKNKADVYEMDVTIGYLAVVRNLSAKHIESGRIRGPVE